jgi:glycosyltransferase involved in cell wall biosynthesis
MDPLVSVIVCVRNGEEFLQGALSNIQAMVGGLDFEVVAVNDHSEDGSLEILKSWAETIQNLSVLDSPVKGIAGARNFALANAKGKYIWFADVDDEWDPSIIWSMSKTAEMVSADVVIANATRLLPSGTCEDIRDATQAEVIDGRQAFVRTLNGSIQGYLWNKLFTRASFEENSFPLIERHEDLAGVLTVLPLASRIALLPETLYTYKIRSGSISFSGSYNPDNLLTCLSIATKQVTALGGVGEHELTTFKYEICIIPIAVGIVQRYELVDKHELDQQLKNIRAQIRFPEVLSIGLRGKLRTASLATLLALSPRTFTKTYFEFTRKRRIAISL